MKTISTAFTRPRSSFGVTRATVVARMFTLYMSAKPATASPTRVSGSQVDNPQTTVAIPKIATATINVDPPGRPERPARKNHGRRERAERRRGAQHAETDRACVEDLPRVHRQQRDAAAEEDGEEVEADRTEQHARAEHERIPATRLSNPGVSPLAKTCNLARRREKTATSATANNPAATAYTSSGRQAKSRPPIAGPTTTANWPATERTPSLPAGDPAERARASEH